MNNSFGDYKQRLIDLWNKTREHQVHGLLETVQVDDAAHCKIIQEGIHYVRLVVAEMYLAKQTQFFQTYFPAVYATTQFETGGKTIDIVTLADSTKVGEKKVMTKGAIIAKNYPLTPLIPFNSGFVQFDIGLLAIKGQNYLEKFLSTLSDFSGLLAVSQFSQALNIAVPLARGIQALFDIGEIELHLHDALSQGKKGGYYVAIGATELQVKKSDLRVVKDSLRQINKYDPALDSPFEDFSYMLIRIEVTKDRLDWDELEFVKAPLVKMDEALYGQDETNARRYLSQVSLAAQYAPEFTKADRNRVLRLIKEHYTQTKELAGFSGLRAPEALNLQKLISQTLSPEDALKMDIPNFGELMEGS
jgi:hypothetical protein